MLRFKHLRSLRRAEQDMHGRGWWAFHALGMAGLVAAGYILGRKHKQYS